MAEVTINSSVEDVNDGITGGTQLVFTSSTVGYVFTLSSAGRVIYHKTTDGGATWGAAVNVSSFTTTACYPSIWYDQWTPGDTSGTLIHITYGETGLDGYYYRSLDTNGDSLGTERQVTPDLGIITVNGTAGSICKATDGDLFVYGAGTSSVSVWRSNDGGVNWSDTTASFLNDNNDVAELLPLASGAIIIIWDDASANKLLSRVYSGGGSWDGSDTTISASVAEGSQNQQVFNASLYKSTNDIYVIFDTATGVSTGDISASVYSGGSWTAKTDLVTNDATLGGVAMFVDNNNGDVYGFYTKGGTYNSLTDVYYRKSTDGMSNWGTETKLSTTQDDLRIVYSNMTSSAIVYAVWYNDDLDDLLGDKAASLGGAKTVNVSQSVTVSETVTNMVQSYKSVSDSVTVSETVSPVVVSLVNASQSVTVSEATAQILVHLINASDTATVSETITLLIPILYLSASDSVTVSESQTLLVSSFVNSSDSVTVSEATSVVITSFVSSTDTVTVSETTNVTQAFNASVSETVTLSETVTPVVVSFVATSDSVTVSEATSVAVVDNAYSINASDSVSVSEAVKLFEESYISASDSVSVSEATNQIVVSLVSPSESVTVSEAVSYLVTSFISQSDSATVSESITLLVPVLYVSASETATVSESQKLTVESFIASSDSVTVSESVTPVIESYIAASDSVSISESIIVTSVGLLNISQSVSVTDTANVFSDASLTVSVSDSVTVSENTSATVYLPDLLINIREVIGPYKFIYVDGQLAMRITGKFYTLL